MIADVEAAIKPSLDRLWSCIALDATGAVGWTAASVGRLQVVCTRTAH